MSQLQLENLRRETLGPINLVVESGRCAVLSGPSGAGKTLLLRAIADLDPHDGQVYLDGRSSQSMSAVEWRRQLGFLTTESQWWYDSVGQHFQQLDHDQWQQLGFGADVAGWQVSRLSTGERQRLALLRLLTNNPKTLLLDEPTASLDPDNTLLVEELVKNYQSKTAAAVIWISHDPSQIDRVADQRYQLAAGCLSAVSP